MKKKMIWGILSVCLAAGSIWMVAKQGEAFNFYILISNLREMHKGWLLMALVSMFGFIYFESRAIVRIAKSLHVSDRRHCGLVYGAADVYFSAITPSASGGQPASAYFMIKDGMSGSAVAVILLLNLIMYSMALITIGGLTFLLSGTMILQVSAKFRILFLIETIVLLGLALLFYLALKKEHLLWRICDKLLHLLEKLGLAKRSERKRRKLRGSLQNYKQCAEILSGDHRLLAEAFLLNLLQRLSQLAVTFFVFMSCGRGMALSLKAMTLQTFVAVGSNSAPIPGAMGIADYMMLDGFSSLLGSSEAVPMELLCRGITFYGCVISGGIITAIGYCMRRREKKC